MKKIILTQVIQLKLKNVNRIQKIKLGQFQKIINRKNSWKNNYDTDAIKYKCRR